ncbi:MAG: GlcG/HbpS family heme-binding protein [Granulosicoccaceae bacterium]
MKLKAIALSALLVSPAGFAEEALTISFKQLTMETALQVAQNTVLDCREKGYQVAATVVDRSGVVQAVVRDSLAPPVTIPISEGKARAAVNFTSATSALSEGLANGPVGRTPGLTMSAGGVPIQAAGQTLGAVGVSGAPGGDIDEACAQAGADSVSDDLEME